MTPKCQTKPTREKMTRETCLQGIPRLSKRISCFLAVRHTIPASGDENCQGLQQNFRIFGRGGLVWRPPPYYPREGSRQDLPAGIPGLSQRISCFVTVRHTIPATGDEKFPRTTTKLQNSRAGRPNLEAATLVPARGFQARLPAWIPRFLNVFRALGS